MTVTRSRSLTIPVEDTEIRAHVDGTGLVSVSNLPIGRVVQVGEQWAPQSLSRITGAKFDLQREAISALVKRHHLIAAAATAATFA